MPAHRGEAASRKVRRAPLQQAIHRLTAHHDRVSAERRTDCDEQLAAVRQLLPEAEGRSGRPASGDCSSGLCPSDGFEAGDHVKQLCGDHVLAGASEAHRDVRQSLIEVAFRRLHGGEAAGVLARL